VLQALARAFGEGVQVTRRTPLGGGSISAVERLDTTAGPVVLKRNPHAPRGFFEAEAEGLNTLRTAASGLVIPRVFAVADDFVLLEWLEPGRRGAGSNEDFGRALARLHRTTSPAFGFSRDTFCGTTRQPNAWTPAWVDFYATARLGHQVRLATDAGLLSAADVRVFDALIARLDTLLMEPAEGACLIHGDLWSGNYLVTIGGPALIDPAVYYAHREMELGMMTLFGGFASAVFDAYDDAFALDAGWRDRQPLYQLYHLLNHLNLFGHGYHGQVMTIAQRFV
jgi:protein-ribulosamine 3-kinase